jgi:hypothetical protein
MLFFEGVSFEGASFEGVSFEVSVQFRTDSSVVVNWSFAGAKSQGRMTKDKTQSNGLREYRTPVLQEMTKFCLIPCVDLRREADLVKMMQCFAAPSCLSEWTGSQAIACSPSRSNSGR